MDDFTECEIEAVCAEFVLARHQRGAARLILQFRQDRRNLQFYSERNAALESRQAADCICGTLCTEEGSRCAKCARRLLRDLERDDVVIGELDEKYKLGYRDGYEQARVDIDEWSDRVDSLKMLELPQRDDDE